MPIVSFFCGGLNSRLSPYSRARSSRALRTLFILSVISLLDIPFSFIFSIVCLSDSTALASVSDWAWTLSLRSLTICFSSQVSDCFPCVDWISRDNSVCRSLCFSCADLSAPSVVFSSSDSCSWISSKEGTLNQNVSDTEKCIVSNGLLSRA